MIEICWCLRGREFVLRVSRVVSLRMSQRHLSRGFGCKWSQKPITGSRIFLIKIEASFCSLSEEVCVLRCSGGIQFRFLVQRQFMGCRLRFHDSMLQRMRICPQKLALKVRIQKKVHEKIEDNADARGEF